MNHTQVQSTGVAPLAAAGTNGTPAAFSRDLRVITCPETQDTPANKSVFVGGGISNCPDWQQDFCRKVAARLTEAGVDISADLFNPRRPDFPIHDPSATHNQIKWEWELLRIAGAVSMWFPKETEGPISLFELGRWLCDPKPIYVGIEDGYERAVELRASVEALRPGLTISSTLDEHAAQVANWIVGIGSNQRLTTQSVQRTPGMAYLAGGIRNCPNWQTSLQDMLAPVSGISVYNPRVAQFEPGSTDEYMGMVSKNRLALEQSEVVIFWFPKDMLTPVALCELGAEVARRRPIFIGVEDGYSRESDVRVQARLERPDIIVTTSLTALAQQVSEYFESLNRT
jgi:hypothetical protein